MGGVGHFFVWICKLYTYSYPESLATMMGIMFASRVGGGGVRLGGGVSGRVKVAWAKVI